MLGNAIVGRDNDLPDFFAAVSANCASEVRIFFNVPATVALKLIAVRLETLERHQWRLAGL